MYNTLYMELTQHILSGIGKVMAGTKDFLRNFFLHNIIQSIGNRFEARLSFDLCILFFPFIYVASLLSAHSSLYITLLNLSHQRCMCAHSLEVLLDFDLVPIFSLNPFDLFCFLFHTNTHFKELDFSVHSVSPEEYYTLIPKEKLKNIELIWNII